MQSAEVSRAPRAARHWQGDALPRACRGGAAQRASHRRCRRPAAASHADLSDLAPGRDHKPPPSTPIPAPLQAQPDVPYFLLTVERHSHATSLAVPAAFSSAARYARLVSWLAKEKWTAHNVGAAALAGGSAGVGERAMQAAEMVFVRDVLGPMRLRPGPVPEKVGVGSRLWGWACQSAARRGKKTEACRVQAC